MFQAGEQYVQRWMREGRGEGKSARDLLGAFGCL